jgi:hypothetical protein
MRLGDPFLIGVSSLALLALGAAIGANCAFAPHEVVLFVIIGALLMIVHDMVTGVVIFAFCMTWANRVAHPKSGQSSLRINL